MCRDNLEQVLTDPLQLVRGQWDRQQYPSICYCLYHILIGLYLLIWIVISMVLQGIDKWFIYVTDLGILLITIDCLLQGYLSYQARRDWFTGKRFLKVKIVHKVSFIIESISSPVAILVTIVFWSILINVDELQQVEIPKDKIAKVKLMVASSIHFHALNSVYVVTNTMLTARPIILVNFLYTLLAGVIYIIFTIFYWLAGGTNNWGNSYIYPVLDWNNPKIVAKFIPAALASTFAAYFALWGLSKLRIYIHSRIRGPIVIERTTDPDRPDYGATTL